MLLRPGACSKHCPSDMRGTYKFDNKETYIVIDQKDSMLFCKPRNSCVQVRYRKWEEIFNFEDIIFHEYDYQDLNYGDFVFSKGSEIYAPCIGILPF